MRSQLIVILIYVLATGAHAQQQVDPEAKKKLVEQKLKLIEMLVTSPAAQATSVGREAETPALFEHSRGLIKEARRAMSEQRFDDATKALDDALRNVSKANNRSANDLGLSESVQRKQYQDFEEQISNYRLSLKDMTKDPLHVGSARKILSRIEALNSEAQHLFNAGRLGDANKKMAEAYKIAVEEISNLRAGQEVVMSLKFDSPIEEFLYEQKRYQSNEILTGMMLGEGRATGETRKLVDGFISNAAVLKDDANRQANNNDYKGAVTAMEKAISQLNRALQTMGIPVF
jgi:tetratricopeptide (TPR) repeat protein